MKSFKMLMMVALTILSVSLFAQVSTKYPVKVPNQKSEKVQYPCPMHSSGVMDKCDMCPEAGTASNLSVKEKMKMEAMKIYADPMHHEITKVTGNTCGELSGTTLNLSVKEKMKTETMKMTSYPLNASVTAGNTSKCPKCNMDLKDMDMTNSCCVNPGKTSDKTGKCAMCRTTSNLSPKEKMKMDLIKI